MTELPVDTFKYAVAFSFLAEDEPLAIALSDKLAGRFSTFVYSKQQERLAGTDGEIAFGEVFGTEARVVVVLYRSGWGTTPWTRIEETAIRNRAFKAGYDFTLFVQLVAGEQMPVWLPRTTIWMGYERWGLDATAAVIEKRIGEAGGAATVEGPTGKAARLQRERDFERMRLTFLSSQHGVDEARKHALECLGAVESLAQSLQTLSPPFKVVFSRHILSREALAVSTEGVSISLNFQLQSANSLEGSSLTVKLWRGAVLMDGFPTQATELKTWYFDFDMLPSQALVWREEKGEEPIMDSTALAQFAVSALVDQVEVNRKQKGRTFL